MSVSCPEQVYLALDANGKAGANFQGIVSSNGINLPAGDINPPDNTKQIQWLRASDGALIASLYSIETATQDLTFLQTIASSAAKNSFSGVAAFDDARDASTAMFASYVPSTNRGSVYAQTYDGSTVRTRSVLETDGKSSFVQDVGAAGGFTRQFYLNAGSATCSWAGGSPITPATVITGTPWTVTAGCIASPIGPNSGLAIAHFSVIWVGGTNPAQFAIQAVESQGANPGAGTSYSCYWIAFGF
jgi:hypothetical protein